VTVPASQLTRRRRARASVAAIVVTLAALLAWALWPRPPLVETGLVAIGTFEQTLREDGRLRVRDRYLVAAPVAGALRRPALRVGDAVRAGDVLLEIHPGAPALIDARSREVLARRVDAASAAGEAARAEVGRATVALAQARLEAKRAERLADARFIAPSALDQSRAVLSIQQQALEAAQAQSRVAEHALAEARAALAGGTGAAAPGVLRRIRAPVSARVLKVLQESEAPVGAGQPLLELGDTTRLEAVVDLLSGDALRLRIGGRVDLHTGRGQPPLPGRVARIEPVAFTRVSALGIEEQRVNVVVAIEADDPARARAGDGFRVDAVFHLERLDDSLIVPSGALLRSREGGWAVLRVTGGRAQRVALDVLDRNVEFARVSGPLAAGDRLILYPGAGLRDGDRVREQPAEAIRHNVSTEENLGSRR